MHGVFSTRHEYLIYNICSLLPEPGILTQNCTGFCLASLYFVEPQCVEICSFMFPLSIEDFTGLWWNIHLTLSFLSVHIWNEAWCHQYSMSSALSPLIKMRKFARFSSTHWRVWMQHEAAWSGPPVLASLINLHHHTALWEDLNSHCLVLRKKTSTYKFLFLSALPLASNPISVPWKVNYFFVSLSFQQKDGPFSVSMGPRPSCCSCSLLASSRLPHPSSISL